MKKFLACFLKIIALLTVLAAAAYAVALNWERIEASVERLKDALAERKNSCCRCEEDDYADWDEEC